MFPGNAKPGRLGKAQTQLHVYPSPDLKHVRWPSTPPSRSSTLNAILQVGETGAQATGKALTLNNSLTELDLSENSLQEGAGPAIGQELALNATLTQLEL